MMGDELTAVIERMNRKILGDVAPKAPDSSGARESEIQTRIRSLRLPPTIRDFLITGVDRFGRKWIDSEPYVKARKWITDPEVLIVVLAGIVGAGKTAGACRVLAEGISGAFISSAAYCDVAAKKRGRTYWTTRTLVLDDLGVEAPGASFEIDKLVLERHGEGGSTIITTTLDGDAFADRYSPATVSRLREVGRWVTCKQLLRRQ